MPAMLLYAETLCPTAALARTRVPLAHLLGGLGLALLGPRLWIVALGGLVLTLAVALQRRADAHVLGHVALTALYWVGAAAGAALRPLERPPRAPVAPVVTWWYAQRRVAALAALALLAGWRIDDTLCVSGVPVGLARSFMLWLGAALLDLYVWAPPGGAAAAHVRYVVAGSLGYACLVPWATLGLAAWARLSAAGAALLACAGVLRLL